MPVPDPITRQEQFLNAAATGDTSNLPDPITREEVYLDAIARNGSGGGGSGSGVFVIHNASNGTLDKTAGEIYEVYTSGQICMVVANENPDGEDSESFSILTFASKYAQEPTVYSYEFETTSNNWFANSPTDYPSSS